jgi:hypothetical protein
MNRERKKRFVTVAKWVLGIAVALCIAGAMRRYSADLRAQLSQLSMDPAIIAVAMLVAVVYRVLNSCGWVYVLRSLRCHLPTIQGSSIWLTSETMRWLPGSVWGYVSRVYAARQAGVDGTRASLSVSLELFLTVVAWSITAVAGVLFSGMSGKLMAMVHFPHLPSLWLPAAVVLAGSLCIPALPKMHLAERMPKKVRDLLGDLKTLAQRPPRMDYCGMVLVSYVALCILNGLNFWLVLRALSPSAPPFTAVIAINAIGWLTGFFAFMAPGGLGVREAGIAGMLALFTPLPVAVTAALLWRVLQVVVELFCLTFCMIPSGSSRDVPVETSAIHR